MLERELTAKQEAFATARARGKSWADSYREAYEPSNPRAASVYAGAHRTRSNPLVIQRIAELRAQLNPAPDAGTLYRKVLATAIGLLEKEQDGEGRVVAFEWATAEIERMREIEAGERKKVEARERAEERARIAAEVRSQYAKEVPDKTPPVERAEEEPGEASGEEASEAIVEETGERMPGEEEAPEPPRPRYRMENVPLKGHHPPRYVRRLVSY